MTLIAKDWLTILSLTKRFTHFEWINEWMNEWMDTRHFWMQDTQNIDFNYKSCSINYLTALVCNGAASRFPMVPFSYFTFFALAIFLFFQFLLFSFFLSNFLFFLDLLLHWFFIESYWTKWKSMQKMILLLCGLGIFFPSANRSIFISKSVVKSFETPF